MFGICFLTFWLLVIILLGIIVPMILYKYKICNKRTFILALLLGLLLTYMFIDILLIQVQIYQIKNYSYNYVVNTI